MKITLIESDTDFINRVINESIRESFVNESIRESFVNESIRESFVNEEYSNNVLYGYHVTYKENLESIFKNGLKVGGAAMQGRGLYAFYYLDNGSHDAYCYATKTNKDVAIIQFSVPPRNILIFDSTIAKEVLGNEYLISDQIKRLDYSNNVIEQSAKMHRMSSEDFEKKINDMFINNERNWWMESLGMDYQKLGTGRLFEGEYGMTYIILRPENLDIIGYYEKTIDGYENKFSSLKIIKDNTILDIINKDDTYNNLKTNLNVNQIENIGDVNKFIAQFEETQMKVRNNREYDLYNSLIDDLNKLKNELKNQSTDTTDYSKIRGIA